MIKKSNVLVFPCGAENALGVINALKYNIHFEIFGVTNRNDYSEYVLDDAHLEVGDYSIGNADFIKRFNNLLKKHNIQYIIPTHDEIILFLAEHQNEICATVIASPVETCRVAFGKIDTMKVLAGEEYLPRTYSGIDNLEYPIFIKPNHGAGGKGTRLIKNREELLSIDNIDEFLISEYLPGNEFTVDCFTNRHGKLLFVGPRTRERITTGISFRSRRIELTDEIKDIAESINSKLRFRGLWFFQLKKDKNNNYKLMEISVRCAGTMDLYRELGVNFSCLSLFDFMGYDVEVLCNDYNIRLERYYKSSYKVDFQYRNVYIDFDDTIIIGDKINLVAIRFLYQCLNKGIKVILLTRHETDIYEDLKRYKIDDNLFDEIIQIGNCDEKVDFINRDDAIFIDNYFPERKKVFERKKIAVFDVDAIESLLVYN